MRRAGLELTELAGMAFNRLRDRWPVAPKDLDVNYMAVAGREEQTARAAERRAGPGAVTSPNVLSSEFAVRNCNMSTNC